MTRFHLFCLLVYEFVDVFTKGQMSILRTRLGFFWKNFLPEIKEKKTWIKLQVWIIRIVLQKTKSNFWLHYQHFLHEVNDKNDMGCFLLQSTAEPNQPNRWKWRCCHTSYIFHSSDQRRTKWKNCRLVIYVMYPYCYLPSKVRRIFTSNINVQIKFSIP